MCKLVGVAATSCFERRLQNVLSNVTYSPNHRQASAPLINIQSTLRSASNLCKNVSLKVLYGNNGNSYTVSTQSDMCIQTHILHSIETLVGQKKQQKLRQHGMPRAKEIFPHAVLDMCAIGSPALF